MFKPMYALQKDASGDVLAANDFNHEYQLSEWVRKLEFRPGDVIEFREVTVRPEFDEVEPEPAFIAPAPSKPALVDEDKPF